MIMKLVSNYIDGAFGAGFFPLLSLFIFVVLFALLIVWVAKSKKDHISEMKNLPFDNQHQNDKA